MNFGKSNPACGISLQVNLIAEIASVIKLTSTLQLSWAYLAISLPVYCLTQGGGRGITPIAPRPIGHILVSDFLAVINNTLNITRLEKNEVAEKSCISIVLDSEKSKNLKKMKSQKSPAFLYF